jgi:D-amino-acid oxidase
MKHTVAIVGAGISGMSVAYLLINKGFTVIVYAKAFPPDTTSNKAAAFWFPYHIRNDKRGIEWCNTSYRYYQAFAQRPETGISMQQLNKVLRKDVEEEEPVWTDFMPEGSYCLLPESKLPEGFARIYNVKVPLIETQIFLPWLQQQLQKDGVIFKLQEITSLEELAVRYDTIINCAALGARKLCSDESVIPVRGQVALLSPGGSSSIYLDNEKLLYVVPRKDATIVGGTYENNVYEEAVESSTINQILENAYEALPLLKEKKLIGSWAGLRPYRKEVRVEKEPYRNIIHNYGHGGSGFTLAFGCAEAVFAMLENS